MNKFFILLFLFVVGTWVSFAQSISGPQVVCSNDLSNYIFAQVVPPPCDTAHNCSFVWEIWNASGGIGASPLFTQSQSQSNQNPTPWSIFVNWNTMYASSNNPGNPRYFTITMRKTGCVPSNCSSQNNQVLAMYTVEVNKNPSLPQAITGTGSNGITLTTNCGSTTPIVLSVPTVAGAVSYSWTYPSLWTISGSNISNSITIVPHANTGQGQTICVYALGSGSCDDGPNISQVRCLTVNRGIPAAGSPITPAGLFLCANATQTLYTTASNIAGASYTWQITTGQLKFNANNSTTFTTIAPSIVVKAPSLGVGTSNVSVRVNTSCGSSSYSAVTSVGYGVTASVTENASNVDYCEGGALAVSATSSCSSTYSWYRSSDNTNWTFVSSGANATINVAPAPPGNSNTTYYKVNVQSAGNIITKLGLETTTCLPNPCPGCQVRLANNSENLVIIIPNPSNGKTEMNIDLSVEDFVKIELWDSGGRKLKNMYQGVLPKGNTSLSINESENLASGVYFVRVIGTNFQSTQKLLIVK